MKQGSLWKRLDGVPSVLELFKNVMNGPGHYWDRLRWRQIIVGERPRHARRREGIKENKGRG